MYMYTLGTGRILIKSNIIVCLLNLMAWTASWAHRTGENEKKDNDKTKNVGPNVERLWSYLYLHIRLHYANTPMQYTAIFHSCENVYFHMEQI